MSNRIDDNVLLSCSTLNLSSGYCYCFVIDKDYNASRVSFNSMMPGDEKRTEKVQLFEDEQLVVNDFIEKFIKQETKKDFDFDVVFDLAVNYNGTKKTTQNNQDWEAKTYELIDSIVYDHKELSSDYLHQLPQQVISEVPTGPVLKKKPEQKKHS